MVEIVALVSGFLGCLVMLALIHFVGLGWALMALAIWIVFVFAVIADY